MKNRTLALILAFGMAIPVLGLAAAAGPAPAAPVNGSSFIDANNDGVCDNLGTGLRGAGRGQGVNGRGRNVNTAGNGFVDADNDGVCDNINTRQGSGCGGRWHK